MAYIPSTSSEYAYYPVQPELRCGKCGDRGSADWVNSPPGGCQYRAHYLDSKPTIACKNGKPYDCKCNLIQEPYSMPFEAKWPGCVNPRSGCNKPAGRCRCPKPGVWYSRAPHFLRET